jgi:hypothetical protein
MLPALCLSRIWLASFQPEIRGNPGKIRQRREPIPDQQEVILPEAKPDTVFQWCSPRLRHCTTSAAYHHRFPERFPGSFPSSSPDRIAPSEQRADLPGWRGQLPDTAQEYHSQVEDRLTFTVAINNGIAARSTAAMLQKVTR